jgi:hypothetical protein
MPLNRDQALSFLQTQWSSINENKIKGITAELAFKDFLRTNNVHFVSGGWLLMPGNCTLAPIPAREKICILPRHHHFTWEDKTTDDNGIVNLAEISAYNYFRHVGVKALFAQPRNICETDFALPTKSVNSTTPANYPRSYDLDLLEIAPDGRFKLVSRLDVFKNFPRRNGRRGLRCNSTGRLDATTLPWTNDHVIADLFWFEYCRYFIQTEFLVSNNDLDLFLIGQSGTPYPVELKSKKPSHDKSLGDWFGIDMGPFAKLSFFTANSMSTDAIYVVEEVDKERNHIEWYALKFTDLVKSCSWVGQAGGTGMMGGGSSTYKIPKTAFTTLSKLLPTL